MYSAGSGNQYHPLEKLQPPAESQEKLDPLDTDKHTHTHTHIIIIVMSLYE